jgi:ABC-type branched-subunit amino acid transport system substrate-binding protein
VREIVTRMFEQINAAGGMYGRRIDVRFAELPAAADVRRDAVRKFLDDEQPFALTASSLLGAERAIAELLEEHEVPSIAAFSGEAPELRYLFRLLGGATQEAAALRAFAGGDVVEIDDTTPLDAMRDAKAVLVTAPPARLTEILRAAAAPPSPPRVLVVSPSAGEALFTAPASLEGRITVALPAGPAHLTADGMRDVQTLSPRAAAHPQTAAAALASARVLAEALRRAGRDVSREKLVEALEGFYQVPTALTPPITFGPTTRVGTRGAWLAEIDLRTGTLVNGRWQSPQ